MPRPMAIVAMALCFVLGSAAGGAVVYLAAKPAIVEASSAKTCQAQLTEAQNTVTAAENELALVRESPEPVEQNIPDNVPADTFTVLYQPGVAFNVPISILHGVAVAEIPIGGGNDVPKWFLPGHVVPVVAPGSRGFAYRYWSPSKGFFEGDQTYTPQVAADR